MVFAFASEIAATTRAVLANNFDVGDIYGDIGVRDDSRLTGQIVDFYTAGPPLGRHERRRSEGPRGLAFLRVLETVGKVKPRAFVIESVTGLLSSRQVALRGHIVGYL